MSKREKVILGVMGLAILYGVYAFFLSPSPSKNDAVKTQQVPSSELANKVVEELKKDALSQTEIFILSKAQTEWPQDPFLGKPLSSATAAAPKAAQSPEIKLTYSGYVVAGNKALAIINGMEYQTGDPVESGGYTVISIDPEKVVLQSEGKKEPIIVPFVE